MRYRRGMARPNVIMKAAITIDGQLGAADGSSQWITGPEARADAHRARAAVDAVMVGAGTVLADDPRLDVRLEGFAGSQPVPVVMAGQRPLPADAQIFDRDPIVFAPMVLDVPGRVIVTPDRSGTRINLVNALELLAGLGVGRVLVEGGAGLLAALLAGGLIDRGIVYFGAKLAGGVGTPLFGASWATFTDAHEVEIEAVRMIGPDVRVDFGFRGRPAL